MCKWVPRLCLVDPFEKRPEYSTRNTPFINRQRLDQIFWYGIYFKIRWHTVIQWLSIFLWSIWTQIYHKQVDRHVIWYFLSVYLVQVWLGTFFFLFCKTACKFVDPHNNSSTFFQLSYQLIFELFLYTIQRCGFKDLSE